MVGDLSKAGQYAIRSAQFNRQGTGPTKQKICETGPVWTDDAFSPVEQLDLLGQWQPLEPNRLKAEWPEGL